jgi:hypothetical protein
MASDAPLVIGEQTPCSGVYVMQWEAARFTLRVPRRLSGSRPVRWEVVAAEGKPKNPLEVLGETIPDDWRQHGGLQFDVILDVTPLEDGRFGHRGWLRWRPQVDGWVSMSPAQNDRSSS